MSKSETSRIGRKKPVKLYIHEWMKHRDKNQVDIANRLEQKSTGTISKKLAKPEKMSVEWLAKFAWALDCDVEDLYRDPKRPTQEDLLRDVEEPKRLMLIEMIKAAKRA